MAVRAFDRSANCVSVRLFVTGLCCALAETQRGEICQRAEEMFPSHMHSQTPNK